MSPPKLSNYHGAPPSHRTANRSTVGLGEIQVQSKSSRIGLENLLEVHLPWAPLNQACMIGISLPDRRQSPRHTPVFFRYRLFGGETNGIYVREVSWKGKKRTSPKNHWTLRTGGSNDPAGSAGVWTRTKPSSFTEGPS